MKRAWEAAVVRDNSIAIRLPLKEGRGLKAVSS